VRSHDGNYCDCKNYVLENGDAEDSNVMDEHLYRRRGRTPL
jgi:hypothetical protein